ncbi:bifunctional 4-hydroxy-2-oxoglutarate aldolase/2-dehydro-3-deoxy-phosphogluconate aldolase [Mycolicibacterium sp. CH28]|uniref:bifunctional 4-hydroxy-2-oxoglutarate aldolase/2-dehydro-3-deoxy-phosphogluconate aldolase n=1 Tax=Mycolicibacterium sp. CH28 TaxID=2512237 RepID=UPI0010817A0F|nr:bifunctional 4-hydroxy-2-oxoglutarate aldolase/2-dehydro-3-deoxy-phosphogluconate aldolase [Mycolicibacterium sp. CH28]TGD88896.1 bifunctional 4-hydroxy-2-oxoglutarate aldolase/2-dehydro-3-deoxy-phosphogluconate aldolase [Mycolicibacterium sp. CH28]
MTGDTELQPSAGILSRPAVPDRTAQARLIVVVRAADAADYDRVVAVLLEAGIRSIELTLTTPGTIERLPKLLDRFGDVADIGVGTVTDSRHLAAAIDAGAHYLVTPITDVALVSAANVAGVPIIPGGLTPTELFAAWQAGATAVKVFPANQVGPDYVRDLRGPFPDIAVVPSGGVDLRNALAWLAAGATAVSVGGPLLGDAVRGGDLAALRERAATFVAACAEFAA